MYDRSGFSTGEPYPGREMRGRIGLSPGEPYPGGVLLRGRTGIYKAGFVGRIASICVDSDWVTPFRISPQTCMGLLPIDVALSHCDIALPIPASHHHIGSDVYGSWIVLPLGLCYSSLGKISQWT